MRAKKKLSTRPKEATVERHENPIRLPPQNSKYLYYVRNLGSTKSWVRETSRCKGSEDQLRLSWPQLHHLDESPYSPSVSYLCRQQLEIEASICRILPLRNAKIPSKFAPTNFVPVRLISYPYNINVGDTRLELSGVASPTLLLYRWNLVKNSRWMDYKFTLTTKYECSMIDPFDAKKKCMQFTSIIKFEGTLFALSLQGVMQEIDSRLTITAISSSRAVPSTSWRYFKEYLVDLHGDILLVFLIHEKTVRVLEVYRLCFPDLKWIKVERIQDNTLFLDHDCCIYVNSKEIGGGENCIYFTQGSNNCWWKYDMGRDCISPA